MESINTEAPAQQEVAAVAGGEAVTSEPSMLDKAAHDYRRLIPEFYKSIEFFSKKQLHRMLEALIEYPLERDYPKFTYAAENKAFYLGMHIFDCKNMMIREAMNLAKNQEKLKEFTVELEKLAKEQGEKKV